MKTWGEAQALLLPGSSKLTVFAQLGSRRFSRKINSADFYGIPMCFLFQMKQCQCHYLMFISMKGCVMLIFFHPLSMDTQTIFDTPTAFLLWIKPPSKNPHRKQNGFRCLNDLYNLAWEQWDVCACIAQKGPSKPMMQQTHDAMLFAPFPLLCKSKNLHYPFHFWKILNCLPMIYSCGVIKHRIWPGLGEAQFPALWFLTSETIYYLLASNYHNHLLLWILVQKRFPISFLNLKGNLILKLSWMENFHESGNKIMCMFSSCLFTRLVIIGFKMPWPAFLFSPWSIFCCCFLIHPVPKGTNAWKCLHFSLVSWKWWPTDKKNTSATIIGS